MLVKISAVIFLISVVFIVGVGIFALVMKFKKNKKNYQ